MKKFQLLLLDANIVIEIARQGLWEQLLSRCNIQLAQTVFEEAQFYNDDYGQRHDIDLTPYISAGSISVFSVEIAEVKKFCSRFNRNFAEQIHIGEVESLAYLLNQPAECKICSADKIVFRVLGALKRSEQGISLEEVLQQIGLSRQLKRAFTKDYRDQWSQKGFQEGFTGLAVPLQPRTGFGEKT